MTDTLQQIHAAFAELLREDGGKLSVQNIADRCAISRNTFYYYYECIEPLAAKLLDGWFTAPEDEPQSLSDCIEPFVARCQQHKAEVLRLFDSPYRHILCDKLRVLVTERLTKFCRTRLRPQLPREEAAAELSLYAHILMGFIEHWLGKSMASQIAPYAHRLEKDFDKLYPPAGDGR